MLRFLLLTGCLGMLVGAAGCSTADTSAADAQAVKDKDAAWSKDVATKDPAKFSAYYAQDATLLIPNEPIVHGVDNIKAAIGPMMQDPNFALSFGAEKVECSGSLCYSQGAYSMTTTGKDGKPFNDKGKYLTVWRKQADGGWKAIEDMINSDLPVGGN
ncbi:MAG TPA: DUF4440 domain-containing protein [Bryobacteraceae bacterium]|nr:DUF4440 domain-containing protein [Bryobacteraceae bacterium]